MRNKEATTYHHSNNIEPQGTAVSLMVALFQFHSCLLVDFSLVATAAGEQTMMEGLRGHQSN